ncbi:MAG: TIGR03960 family B12-binding radical SAM protein [Cyanobacteriota bacterium]|nr:TIGR03960 family B12-binding radical SAM protein [Cyanobacteriota bacterium]
MPPINLDPILSSDIQKPARYLGNEFGAARRPWSSARVRWVLSYPELYEVGASNLGHIILYNILNGHLHQLCDRVYLPGSDLAALLRQQGIPLFAVESRRPLREFDVVGFSLAYELAGTNVLEMLDLAGIPLTWAERQHLPLAECPLIFAGGPTATSNPEPFADFFDFFALGDGEEALPEIGQVIADAKTDDQPPSRVTLLQKLAQVPGVYVPQFYQGIPPRPQIEGIPERILRRVAQPQPEYAVGLVPYVQTVHDRLVMEVRRGCTRGCRFCQPGMLTRPARDVDPEHLVGTVLSGLQQTGYDEFSLSSLSCSDYLALPTVGAALQEHLQGSHTALSLPSQRVDRFDEQIAQIMGGSRRPSLTFAPEAGTQRLRDIINKGLTDAEMLRGITTAVQQGWDKIKLYFMIGLPGETDADVVGIAETMQRLQQACIGRGYRRIAFTLTISNFTPKPHTPFQWHRVDYLDIQRKQALLKKALRSVRGVKANYTDIRFSILEDLIGKGDRSLSSMIQRAWQAGAGMDGWFENIDAAYKAWLTAYQATIPSAMGDPHLPIHTFALTDPLPWDHIDTGIDKAWLQKDYQRALEAMTVPDCSFHGCSACGICGPDFGHNLVLPTPPALGRVPLSPVAPSSPLQRFRLIFRKIGDLRWIGHLDLMRLWERICRRAQLPLAFTGGFRPTPRIVIAHALPIGQTSQAEIVDIELLSPASPISPEMLIEQLRPQLPIGLEIVSAQGIPLTAPAAAQLLLAAEYRLSLQLTPPLGQADTSPHLPRQWQTCIDRILAADHLWIQKVSKSGHSYPLDVRRLLYQLRLASWTDDQVDVIYVGSCRNDGYFLQPKQVVSLLAQDLPMGSQLHLLHIERLRLILQPDPEQEE